MFSILGYIKKIFRIKNFSDEWYLIQHETGMKGDDLYVSGKTPDWLNRKINNYEHRKVLRNTQTKYFVKGLKNLKGRSN